MSGRKHQSKFHDPHPPFLGEVDGHFPFSTSLHACCDESCLPPPSSGIHQPTTRVPQSNHGMLSWNFLSSGGPYFLVVLNSGATISITPHHEDFITPLTSTEGAVMQSMAKGLPIVGSGTI